VIAEPPTTRHTYAGLFLISLATLMYEILLTRIFSVTMLYHFAFVAISVAMFGMTVGALVVYLFPAVFRDDTAPRDLVLSAAAFPLLIVFSFLTQLSIPFFLHPSVVAIYAIALTYTVIAVPFVASGVAVSLALTKFPSCVSRLYAADLAGAAIGCVLVVPVIGYSDGPTAVLIVATLAAIGAFLFARDSPSIRLRRLTAATAVGLAIVSAGNLALVWKHFPIFRILYIRGSFEARPLYEKWNSYSRVRVNGDPAQLRVPTGWGLSARMPADLRSRQLQMDIDVAAGTVMTGFTGDLGAVRHLRYDVTNIAYYVREHPDVLVVGAGGGRDVLSALAFGARHVTAVEINKDIIRTVNGRFADFTGHLDRRSDVTFVNDEARSFIARQSGRYDVLQISLIDTWAATAAGAFVLSENSLYTSEAWALFMRRLTDGGILSVSRWYFRDRPAEVYRTTTLATEALRSIGVQDPRAHVVIVRNMQLANKPDVPDGVGTILVSRSPFSAADLDRIDAVCRDLGFEVMLSPRTTVDDLYVRLLDLSGSAAAARQYAVNITAPTDDSPFFFNMLRLRDVFNWRLLDSGKQTHNMKAVFVLAVLLVTVIGLTVACVWVPLWIRADRAVLSGSGSLLGYFAAIGLGFMLIETSQMQRLIIVLGHPTYGLTVVLFALLLSSGLGSYLTSAIDGAEAGRAGLRRLIGLLGVLILFGIATPAAIRWFEPATTPVRIFVAVALLAPPGVLMGMAFPLGMKAAAISARGLAPWLWGINGATSVVASVLSVCIALTWSISAAFWTGAVSYGVAALYLYRATRAAGQPAP
jgi:hypothetical protein